MEKEIEKQKVAIYIRLNKTEQGKEGYSLEEQEKVLRRYCDIRNHEVVCVYSDEGITRKNSDCSSGMKKLLTDAKKKKFDVILVWKLTILAKGLSDLIETCENLKKINVNVVSYSENFDYSMQSGKPVRDMLDMIKQFEREAMGEVIKTGHEARAAKGKRTSSEVLGYDIYGDSFIINEKEAEYVRFVFESYLVYQNLTYVAKLCNERGYKGKRGHEPKPYMISKILSRPIYCGFNTYSGKLYKGSHEPIIDIDTFNKAQILLKEKGRKTKGRDGIKVENIQ